MIITSLLDTDLYKFTMQSLVLHHYPYTNVEYEFKLRNHNKSTLLPYVDYINDAIDDLCKLKFRNDELEYLRSLSFMKDDYIDVLRTFQFDRKNINCAVRDDELQIIVKGNWYNTILFEVPVLAIVSEVYNTEKHYDKDLSKSYGKRLREKCNLIKGTGVQFADFGTRRRFSKDIQAHMIHYMKEELPNNFIGTSNVFFAKYHDLKPIGTMAHEYIQAMQQLVPLIDSQKHAFDLWAKEYRGELGIALSDTLGMKAFLNDFDLYHAKLYDGVRQDSGDPIEWCEQLLKHYEYLGINPVFKTAVFSDGLDFNKAIELHELFCNKIKVAFGIGTYLTNDMGIEPLQIVMKMTKCRGQPVAKISDSPGKQMCTDQEYLNYLCDVFNIKRWNDGRL